MSSFRQVGVLAHPARPQTFSVAEEITQSLQSHGLKTWQFHRWENDDELNNALAQVDLVIAIGGDGAMLHAGRVCAQHDVPVFGVNMGHLGFLTEVQAIGDWDKALHSLMTGHWWVEKRMMLSLQARREDQIFAQEIALNDAVLGRDQNTRMIRLETYINLAWTTTYHADALIVATATGSTAYALASGGPILPPELRNTLIVPVAPHLSLDRPIVLPEGALIDVMIHKESVGTAVLWADGMKVCDLVSGDRVTIRTAEKQAQFIRLREEGYFYRSLLDRLEPRTATPPDDVHLDSLDGDTHFNGS